jgi:predicted GNAT family acetyltransferase
MSAEDEIVYRPDSHRFEYVLGEHVAVCDYEDRGDTWVFNHTYVPPAFRGRGVAGKLARAGLELARSRGKKVIPACSFVAKYIEATPEFKDLLSSDITTS